MFREEMIDTYLRAFPKDVKDYRDRVRQGLQAVLAMVPPAGFEPARREARVFETPVSTNSTTEAGNAHNRYSEGLLLASHRDLQG